MPEVCFKKPEGRVKLLQGNEAIVLGALEGGIEFFGGYPITPSSEIAEMLSKELPKVGGVFIQMEDEIASLGSVIGASLGGAKAMTATSGPGFSLMQEHIGFAALAEVPCVIVNVQRGGPSTGLPTSPAQGDVMQSRWGTHGDHPIIVLSPSNVFEAYMLTIRAFNLAEKYRTPVILLTDEVVAHIRETVILPKKGHLGVINRDWPTLPPQWYTPYYDEVKSLVPPLAPFGEGYRYHVTGLIHDRYGFPTMVPREIKEQMQRLFNKIIYNVDDIIWYQTENLDDAEIVIVSYGISARSGKAAMMKAREMGKKVGFVKLLTLWPFPEVLIKKIVEKSKYLVIPELNKGQIRLELERVSEGKATVIGVHKMTGQMIKPDEILKKMEVEIYD